MWISFTDRTANGPTRAISAGRLGVLLALSVVMAACATRPPEKTGAEKAVSKYAQEQKGGAAASSNAAHVPPVVHAPGEEAQAKQAIPDYYQALQFLKKGDLQKAMVMFQSVSAQFPKLSGPLVNQGLIYIKQKDFDNARQVLEQAVKVNAGNPYAWNALGVVNREQGKFKDAQADYEKALALDGQYARAHFNLGVLADLYLQNLPLALKEYQAYQGLQQNPDKNVAIWIKDLQHRIGTEKPATTGSQQSQTPAKGASTSDSGEAK